MGNNIIQKLKYKESVVKYSYKHGVTKAAIAYGKCKRTILIVKNHLMKKDRKKLKWLNLHLNKYYLQKQNKLIQNQKMVLMKFL